MRRGTMTAAGLLAVGLVACTGAPEGPDPVPPAGEWAAALASGEVLGPSTDAQQGYDDLLDGALSETTRSVEVVDVATDEPDGEAPPEQATATLRWTWELAGGADEPWTYDTEALLLRDGEGWAPQWDPAVVHPELREGSSLDLSTLEADRGDIVGADGTTLVTERPVTRFGIARDQVPKNRADRSARELATLLGIRPAPFARRVLKAGPRAFVEGLTLRKADIPIRVGRGYRDIPGAFAVADRIPLGPTSGFARPILGTVGEVTAEMIKDDPSLTPGDVRGLSGLQARYDDQLSGTPGVQVSVVDADGGRTTAHEQLAVGGEDLVVAIDQRLQLAAERILASVGPAAALVAVRPSDGAVVAAASGPGSGEINLATYGRAAPGSTFKIVSALALLRTGATPGSTLACPASTVVDGKRFENYDGYPPGGLGQIALRAALANSCNTAFVDAASRLPRGALAEAAASLGLGIDHEVGFPAYFGQVPPPESETEAAADMIGQGGILVSPLVMSTGMASVQEGTTVVPWLVDEVRSEVPEDAPALTGPEARQLRALLRNVVRSGTGSVLAGVPGPPVLAKTGTAEFDRDGERLLHAWMVAAQGDLAATVYVDVGESGSRTAGPLLKQFLQVGRAG